MTGVAPTDRPQSVGNRCVILIQTARSTAYFNGCPYIFLIYYHITIYMFVYHIFFTSPLLLAVGPQSLQGGLFTIF